MKQLHPRSVWFFFINFIFRWSLTLILFMAWSVLALAELEEFTGNESSYSFSGLDWLWVAPPILLVFCFIWAELTYKFYKYELTDVGFRKESGVIYKKYVTIPYERIQNVDIYRGIIARILGLSDLNIQTAGASASFNRYGGMGIGAEGRLPAVSKEDAEILRDELVKRLNQVRSQGL